MELHQIRYFLVLSEDLNFSRAAERCGVSQPSLTRAIKRLEDDLGVQLVRRENNRTHLTELGKKIKPQLEQALSLTETARKAADEFSNMSAPRLSIGVLNTIGPGRMMSIIHHLENRFPELTLTLKTSSSSAIINCLLSGEIDVAMVGLPDYPDKVAVHDLYEERYMVAIPPDHHFSRMNAIPLQELVREKALKRLSCEFMDFFHSASSDCDPDLLKRLRNSMDTMDVRYEIENGELIQTMITAGMGCAIVPEYITQDTRLQMRPLVEPEISRTVSVATVRGRPHTPVVSYFSNLCQNMKGELGF